MTLFRNRDFTVFLSVQALSVAGDSFSMLAIPLLVLHATGSVVQMGVLTALSGAASLVTGVFAATSPIAWTVAACSSAATSPAPRSTAPSRSSGSSARRSGCCT